MSEQDLYEALERLHAEIERLGEKDAVLKQRLNELIVDVEKQIQGEVDEEQAAGLIDKLQQQVEQFEAQHPQVTGILNQIMLTLSNMGI